MFSVTDNGCLDTDDTDDTDYTYEMKKGAYFFRLKLEVFVKLYQKFVDIIVTLI